MFDKVKYLSSKQPQQQQRNNPPPVLWTSTKKKKELTHQQRLAPAEQVADRFGPVLDWRSLFFRAAAPLFEHFHVTVGQHIALANRLDLLHRLLLAESAQQPVQAGGAATTTSTTGSMRMLMLACFWQSSYYC
jgi:hypothetical protein